MPFGVQARDRQKKFRYVRNDNLGCFHEFKLAQKLRDAEIGEEGGGVGQSSHVGELEHGPLPAIGFAADNGERGRALQGEGEEDQQGSGTGGSQVVAESGLQGEVARGGVGTIQSAECSHDYFTGED